MELLTMSISIVTPAVPIDIQLAYLYSHTQDQDHLRKNF